MLVAAILSLEMTERVAAVDAPKHDEYEAALVERARARSSEAWAEIYNSHCPAVFRYIRARVFDDDTAADLTETVFVGAIKSIRSYKYRGKPILAWLYRIARNAVADHQRQMFESRGGGLKGGLSSPRRVIQRLMRRGRADEGDDSQMEVAADPSSDPANLVQNMDLRAAIARLPDSQREVIILRFLVGLSAQEVAEIVGKNPQAVYSLQARALLSLREKLR